MPTTQVDQFALNARENAGKLQSMLGSIFNVVPTTRIQTLKKALKFRSIITIVLPRAMPREWEMAGFLRRINAGIS